MVTCKERKSEGRKNKYQGLVGKENAVFGVKNRKRQEKNEETTNEAIDWRWVELVIDSVKVLHLLLDRQLRSGSQKWNWNADGTKNPIHSKQVFYTLSHGVLSFHNQERTQTQKEGKWDKDHSRKKGWIGQYFSKT